MQNDPWCDIKDYLTMQVRDTLIDLLLDAALYDDRLYQSLLLKAELSRGSGNMVDAFTRAIDKVTCIRGYMDWRETKTIANTIDQVVESLAELLKPDTAANLVELAEYAIKRIEDTLEYIHDSNGDVNGAVWRLADLHLKACIMSRPEPAGLAERLFLLETTLPFNTSNLTAMTYCDVLGKEGLRRYRELAETAWHKIQPRDSVEEYDSNRYRITRIMEQLAKTDGNIEELVAIKAKDLSSSYHYLGIAEILSEANRHDEALNWAERGLKAFSERADNHLRDFSAAAYLKCERNDDALQLTWIQFEERPCLEHYIKLHTVAAKIGVWPVQRERALNLVDTVIATESTSRWKRNLSTTACSLRVEIALWEDDLEAAWTAAQESSCDQSLLIALAGKLESKRPDDAVSLYRRVVPPIIGQTNNTAYETAIRLIRKAGDLMKAQQQQVQFMDYLAELRLQFKPKRNFIKLLDGLASVEHE